MLKDVNPDNNVLCDLGKAHFKVIKIHTCGAICGKRMCCTIVRLRAHCVLVTGAVVCFYEQSRHFHIATVLHYRLWVACSDSNSHEAFFFSRVIFSALSPSLSPPWQLCPQDFLIMFLHHVATISLITFSYVNNMARVGTLVMCLHDAADVLIEVRMWERIKRCGWTDGKNGWEKDDWVCGWSVWSLKAQQSILWTLYHVPGSSMHVKHIL